MASYRFVIAGVFTDTPLQGNQLPVFEDALGDERLDRERHARRVDGSRRDRKA
jgi:predicted PhzF superfamily epimerase YddE/YHI9